MKRNREQTMSLEEASSVLRMSPNYLRDLLRQGKMREIGFATEKDGRWRYYIYRDNVERLRNGKAYNDPLLDDGR